MSYFSTLNPISGSNISPASYTLGQDPAINTISKNLFAVVTGSVDFEKTGTTLLFTTASDRGRFFPTKIIVTAEIVSQSSIYSPTLDIGTNSPNYSNWMNVTLTTPQYTQYGSGQFEFPVLANVFATTRSAAPGTGVYYKVDTASGTCDKRSIVLMGFYTNIDS